MFDRSLSIEERLRATEILCTILRHLATVADDSLTNYVPGLTPLDIARLTPDVCVAISRHALAVKYGLPAAWLSAASVLNEEER
jgi:hypothetical protein